MAKKTATVAPDSESLTPQELKLSRRASRRTGLFAPPLLKAALRQAFVMLRPDIQWKNPVMFVVEVGTVLTLPFTVAKLFGGTQAQVTAGYLISLDIWLILTLLFANFATGLAEARGKAQADTLRKTRRETPALRFRHYEKGKFYLRAAGELDRAAFEEKVSTDLNAGDKVLVETNQIIPGDGEIIEGVASIDESAITGESAPVIREAGGDRSGVTGGTRVLSDRIVVQITAAAGKSFLDRMIALVEGALRQRTPNEIALSLVLSAFTLIFLIVTAALWPMALNAELYMKDYLGVSEPVKSLGTDVPTAGGPARVPDTYDHWLRLAEQPAQASPGWIAPCVPTSLPRVARRLRLQGTWTLCFWTRRAPSPSATEKPLSLFPWTVTRHPSWDRWLPWRRLPTRLPKARALWSYTTCCRSTARRRRVQQAPLAWRLWRPLGAGSSNSQPRTRMSGIDLPDGRQIRKGSADAVIRHVQQNQSPLATAFQEQINAVASRGG